MTARITSGSRAAPRRVDDVGEEDGHRLAALGLDRRCHDAGGQVELLVVPQDRLLELLQLGGRIDAELVDERLPRLAVGLERLCLPPCAVERQHQLSTQPFSQRMLGDQGFELADELSIPPEIELRGDQVFAGRRPALLDARDRYLRELLEREVGKRGATPQSQGLAEQIRPPPSVFGFPCRRNETLEPIEVDAVRVHRKPVARRLRLHRVGPELLAERGDEVLE
jgi:hypothetical protein